MGAVVVGDDGGGGVGGGRIMPDLRGSTMDVGRVNDDACTVRDIAGSVGTRDTRGDGIDVEYPSSNTGSVTAGISPVVSAAVERYTSGG